MDVVLNKLYFACGGGSCRGAGFGGSGVSGDSLLLGGRVRSGFLVTTRRCVSFGGRVYVTCFGTIRGGSDRVGRVGSASRHGERLRGVRNEFCQTLARVSRPSDRRVFTLFVEDGRFSCIRNSGCCGRCVLPCTSRLFTCVRGCNRGMFRLFGGSSVVSGGWGGPLPYTGEVRSSSNKPSVV